MRIKYNKLQLSNVLRTFSFGKDITVGSTSDGVLKNDEADIPMSLLLFIPGRCDT